MELNNNALIKQASFGLYGSGIKELAQTWLIKQIINGKDIPISLRDCFEAFPNFDEAFADEFVKTPNWTALWSLLNHYENSEDCDLTLPRIAGSVVARFIDDNKTKQLQEWIQVSVNDERMVGVVLEKSKLAPELLEWSLVYLKKFSVFRDSAALITLICDIALQHPKFLMQSIGLIVYLGQQRSMYQGVVRLEAIEAMAKIFGTLELSEPSRKQLLTQIDDFAANLNDFELYTFLQEDTYLPEDMKIWLAAKTLSSFVFDGCETDLLDVVGDIYYAGILSSPYDQKIIEAWCGFVEKLAKKSQDLCGDLFLRLNAIIKKYVTDKGWEVALMNWNPGMNFPSYAPEFQKMTLLSLELANRSGHFRPRAFLTALNIAIFDEKGTYNEKWFENYVMQMPNNFDNDSFGDDDLSPLFEHLARLYRYREEIQKKDTEFVLRQAKVFVTCLMSNYALNKTEIEQLKSLCARLELNVDMEAEIAAMNQRREQIAQKRRAEWNHLLKLFAAE